MRTEPSSGRQFCRRHARKCASLAKKFSALSLLFIEFAKFEEAVEISNSINYGLSTSLYTRDVNRAFAAIRDLEAGITYINAPTIGAEVHLPFGG